jgi:predicted peptidase
MHPSLREDPAREGRSMDDGTTRVPAGGDAANRLGSGFLLRELHLDRGTFPFVVYTPRGYDPATPWPVILFLHGRGEEGDDGWKPVAVGLGPAILLEARRWPFVVVFPQKPRDAPGWLEYEDLALGALARVRNELHIDPSRIHLTGVSMGGYGAWMLAPRHGDLFASIAPVCGGGRLTDAPRLRHLPIWAFHGDADPIVPAEQSRRMVDAVRSAGGHPRLTLYPGVGHDSWDRAYRREPLAEWLLDQRTG